MRQHQSHTVALPETHGIALRAGNRLIAHSEGLGWRDLYGSLAVERAWTATLRPVDHDCLVYCLRHAARIRRQVDGFGPTETAVLRPRQFSIIPARRVSHWQIDGEPEILLIYLRREMVDAVAARVFGEGGAALLPRLAESDGLLEELARAIGEMLGDASPGDAREADALGEALALRLLSRHALRPRPRRAALAGTDGADVDERLAAVRRHIVAHPEGDLTLPRLAASAGLSPAHFARLYRRAFGEPPHRFVLRCRLEAAARLLRETGLPVTEIALQTGFASHSHFTNAFSAEMGEAPSAYRRGKRQ